MTPIHPRIEIVLEATRVAQAMREGAEALEDLASASPHYETQVLRLKVKSIVAATIAAAVEAEWCEQ